MEMYRIEILSRKNITSSCDDIGDKCSFCMRITITNSQYILCDCQ